MTMPRSLQIRLAMAIGGLLILLWATAAFLTAAVLRHEMNEVFDSALQETAQRVMPLAVMDIVGREETGITQRLATFRAHEELLAYIVRDAQGRILLQSHAADPAMFPAYDGPGFRQTDTHRLYNDEALQGSIRITVAEPLDHRVAAAREMQMALGLPLVVVIPVALVAIILAVRASLSPLRRFRQRLDARSVRDLSAVPTEDLPIEIAPVAETLNGLLNRLKAAFDAERSFAANAAHELRTPLAGAIAQAQRLRSESSDPATRERAGEIEVTLKRLTRLSERLMQLARAEGGRLRLDRNADLRDVARVVIGDFIRTNPPGRIALDLPDTPVMSDLDPDAFGIICRNLVENALRHGSETDPVDVTLTANGRLIVENEGPVLPPEMLGRLTARFERGAASADGSGLGLAIVAAIATRIGGNLVLESPRPDREAGFAASLQLPAAQVVRNPAPAT